MICVVASTTAIPYVNDVEERVRARSTVLTAVISILPNSWTEFATSAEQNAIMSSVAVPFVINIVMRMPRGKSTVPVVMNCHRRATLV